VLAGAGRQSVARSHNVSPLKLRFAGCGATWYLLQPGAALIV
jgi:hypothetical protein